MIITKKKITDNGNNNNNSNNFNSNLEDVIKIMENLKWINAIWHV